MNFEERQDDIENYQFRGQKIPGHMAEGLARYIEMHVPPGDFLYAVLSNNLMEAASRADDFNISKLHVYAAYLYSSAPSACYGSPERVRAWIEPEKASA